MKVFIIGGTAVPETDDEHRQQLRLMKRAMTQLGKQILTSGHDLLVCSPFLASADEAILRAAAPTVRGKDSPTIELHYPDSRNVAAEVTALLKSLSPTNVKLFTHPLPTGDDGKEELGYGWLLAQLFAMDRSHAVVAIGGHGFGDFVAAACRRTAQANSAIDILGRRGGTGVSKTTLSTRRSLG